VRGKREGGEGRREKEGKRRGGRSTRRGDKLGRI